MQDSVESRTPRRAKGTLRRIGPGGEFVRAVGRHRISEVSETDVIPRWG